MFADDTNIFMSSKNFNELTELANIELGKFAAWFKLNKLSLNITKTNFILFHNRQKQIIDKIDLKIDNTCIEQTRNTKFLGVIINENLTWEDHIKLVKAKVSKNIGIIKRLQKCLPKHILLMLYHSLVHPYFDYCNIVWACEKNIYTDALFKIQKKAVRIISKCKWNCHSSPLFKTNRILNIFDINKLQAGCFVYKSLNCLLPLTFDNYFLQNSLLHTHNTRSHSSLHLFYHRTKARSNCIKIFGSKFWNSLPVPIRESNSIYIFKRKLKSYLLKK